MYLLELCKLLVNENKAICTDFLQYMILYALHCVLGGISITLFLTKNGNTVFTCVSVCGRACVRVRLAVHLHNNYVLRA